MYKYIKNHKTINIILFDYDVMQFASVPTSARDKIAIDLHYLENTRNTRRIRTTQCRMRQPFTKTSDGSSGSPRRHRGKVLTRRQWRLRENGRERGEMLRMSVEMTESFSWRPSHALLSSSRASGWGGTGGMRWRAAWESKWIRQFACGSFTNQSFVQRPLLLGIQFKVPRLVLNSWENSCRGRIA